MTKIMDICVITECITAEKAHQQNGLQQMNLWSARVSISFESKRVFAHVVLVTHLPSFFNFKLLADDGRLTSRLAERCIDKMLSIKEG